MPAPMTQMLVLVSLSRVFSDGTSVVATQTEVVVPEVGRMILQVVPAVYWSKGARYDNACSQFLLFLSEIPGAGRLSRFATKTFCAAKSQLQYGARARQNHAN